MLKQSAASFAGKLTTTRLTWRGWRQNFLESQMSKKHFKVLAEEISLIEDLDARWEAAHAVVRACVRLAPNFDREKFVEACGL